jgi:cyclase
MTDSSRRQFIRSAGLAAGAAACVRYDLWTALDAATYPGNLQAPAAADPVAAMRAQMGAAPIATSRLGDRLTMLSGPGGNVVVLAGPEGKIVVDSFVQPAWPRLKAALDALGGGPIKTLIDTHWHFDHTDNNANFHAAGAGILAHANTRKRLSEPHDLLGMHFDRSPDAALPGDTFSDTRVIAANGETITLTHVAPAHTDTDLFVHYRRANVLHMGDVFFNGTYPFIDVGTGGHIDGMIAGADRALAIANARTKIVPGHGALSNHTGLLKYRKVIATIRDRVRAQKRSGKTLAQVQAAKPSAQFDAEWGKGMLPPNDFVALVYQSLRR